MSPTTSTSTVADRLRFLQIEQADRDILRRHATLLGDALESVIADFYTFLQDHADLNGMFENADSRKRAGTAQLRHWGMI